MSTILQRQYWVFDLDGTLTQPVHDFAHIRAELGIAQEDDILQTLASWPQAQRLEGYARLDELELMYAAHARPAPAVIEMLALLHQRRCRLGILTRNSHAVAWQQLEAIGAQIYFKREHVLGRSEALPKPDPQGIEHLLTLWQAEARDALMVGDYRYDLEAGRACGTATIHVDHGKHPPWPELTDLRVTSLSQLYEMLAEVCN